MKIILMNVERVKTIMSEKNIDIKALSEQTGISANTLKKYLNGADQAHMNLITVLKIGQALKTPVKDIVFNINPNDIQL